MKLREAMTTMASYVMPQQPVANVAKAMVDTGHNLLPVLDGRIPIGSITVSEIVSRSKGLNPMRTPVSAIMTKSPATLNEDLDLSVAAQEMITNGTPRVLVLHADGSLAGIATAGDLASRVDDQELSTTLGELMGSSTISASRAAVSGTFATT